MCVRERERERDTDCHIFYCEGHRPIHKAGGGGGYTIAFLCLQSHNIIVEGKKQVYSMNHMFTRAVFL